MPRFPVPLSKGGRCSKSLGLSLGYAHSALAPRSLLCCAFFTTDQQRQPLTLLPRALGWAAGSGQAGEKVGPFLAFWYPSRGTDFCWKPALRPSLSPLHPCQVLPAPPTSG